MRCEQDAPTIINNNNNNNNNPASYPMVQVEMQTNRAGAEGIIR
jgi:hypothetical protein